MDALQQHHRFMRAPPPPPPPQQQPPPMADQLRASPLQGSWYSSQFQYQASQVRPPPQQQTPWVTHSDHLQIPSAYALQSHQHAAPPYPPAHPHNNQYLPPPPGSHLPPPPPPPPHLSHSHPNAAQFPQPYPPSKQTWGNTSWVHHQSWEYSDRNIPHNNEEDWAARAREWAAAKASMENHHSQSQFPPSGRPEEHSNVYHDQYQQTADPHYIEMQQSSLPAWSHQQFPVSGSNLHRPVNHLQDSTSFGSGQPSYVSDGHISYTARDGALLADSNLAFAHQGSAPTNSSIYQQEVPLSYSSVQGKEETAEHIEQVHQQSLLPKPSVQEGQHHVQPMLPAIGRASSAEHLHFKYENQITDAAADPSDLPLDFVPRFTRENDPHPQAGYTHPDTAGHVGSMDPIAAVPSIHAWTSPAATAVAYPPVPAGAQFEPPFVAPSVNGHSAPIFGRIPGPSFRPPIPTAGAPFGLGAGTAVHPARAFPGDANGVLNVSERPKKASVPNWLREEIIKKAVIPSSVQEHPEEDPLQSVGDDSVDRSYKKSDQADNRSVDSSRSTEDEDDDEDDVEAARTAAINQEIKRVLTEVLLKVTDELFDEIATKVLNEDDVSVDGHNSSAQNHKVSPSSPAVPTLEASAEGLIPDKVKEAEADDVSGKFSSSPPGDVLGLASYASDDDDDEIQCSSVPDSKQTDAQRLQLTNGKLAEDVLDSVKNGSSKIEGPTGVRTSIESLQKRTGRHGAMENGLDEVMELENVGTSAFKVVGEDMINADGEKMVQSDAFESKDAVGGRESMKHEQLPANTNSKKSVADDCFGGEARNKSNKNYGHDVRGSVGKDFVKEGETNKSKTHDRHPDSADTKRRDERHARREKADDRSALKEKLKDRGAKSDEKAKESESRKSSHVNSKDDRKETEKTKRASGKEDTNRKRERARDERGDRSRPKTERDSSGHKRRRSSSASGRGRNSKDNSVGAQYSDSSDVSEGSGQRKMHPKRRSLSPSPTRSRSRQVSRSPHSKHSQRRHSPYSSLETIRGKRSRSNSPVRRRR